MKKFWQEIIDEIIEIDGINGLNLNRFDKIIKMLENVKDKHYYHNSWIDIRAAKLGEGNLMNLTLPRTERELEKCGMVACIGGHLTLQDFFKKAGGTRDDSSGEPLYQGFSEEMAFNAFIGLDPYHPLGEALTNPEMNHNICNIYSKYYDVEVSRTIRVRDVLARMRYIRKQAIEINNKQVA